MIILYMKLDANTTLAEAEAEHESDSNVVTQQAAIPTF